MTFRNEELQPFADRVDRYFQQSIESAVARLRTVNEGHAVIVGPSTAAVRELATAKEFAELVAEAEEISERSIK